MPRQRVLKNTAIFGALKNEATLANLYDWLSGHEVEGQSKERFIVEVDGYTYTFTVTDEALF